MSIGKKVTGILFLLLILTNNIKATDRPKIGLALSGGGARGMAHIATLKMLDSLQIPVDYIVGTSMGGIIGGLYAVGYSGADIEKMAMQTDWQEIFTDEPPRADLPYFQKMETGKYQLDFGLKGVKPVAQSGLIYGQKLSLMFSEYTLHYKNIHNFAELPIPYKCVAVDLVTGNEVVLDKGSLAKAMRSTMAIPSVFSPVEWGDLLLIDGGLVNNLPVDVLKQTGVDIIIALDVTSPLLERKQLTSALGVLEQTFNIIGFDRWKVNCQKADILVSPDISQFSQSDFEKDKISKIFEKGEIAARKSLPQLIALKEKYHLNRQAPKTESNSDHPSIVSIDNQDLIIHGISIEGNEHLPFKFIYRNIGLKPGDILDTQKLHKRIMDLYGLGYFERIHYNVDIVRDNLVQLVITVKEKSMRRLRLGLRYDNYYKLVAVTGLQATNLILPGMRVDYEFQFAGYIKHRLKVYYPSRRLNSSVYPFIQYNYKNVPVNIFDGYGNKVASYKDRSSRIGGGVGMLVLNSINTELAYEQEYMNIKPKIALFDPIMFPSWFDDLRKIRLDMTFDTLDDVLLPCYGVLMRSHFESGLKKLQSDVHYSLFSISADFYKTFSRRHTTRFYSFWGTGSSLPVYKYMLQDKPDLFIGTQCDQLRTTKLTMLRFDYRYRHRKDIFFKLIMNAAFNLELKLPKGVYSPHDVLGAGVGAKLLSPVGPIELVYGLGDENLLGRRTTHSVFYFHMGYQF